MGLFYWCDIFLLTYFFYVEKRKLKKIIFIIYVILIIYSLELLTYFFIIPEQQKLLTNIENTRFKIASSKNLSIDKRSKLKAYLDEKKNNSNLEMNFYFNKDFENYKTFKNAIENDAIIPFRGPVNKLTLTCNEELQYSIIENDMYGFKNSNSIYEKKISVAILGDSYAEGLCQDNKNDISGHLIRSGINTVNLGVTGSGPLLSLAVIREYIGYFNPELIVYLYFEGNDLSDLKWELKNLYLKKYLEDIYNKDYLNNKKSISSFLKDINTEHVNLISKFTSNDQLFINHKENSNLEIIKDLIELTNIRNILKNLIYNHKQLNTLDNLFIILTKMNSEIKNQNKKFLFVYIPSWERYFTKANKNKIYFDQKEKIIRFLSENKIEHIDFDKKIKNTENKEDYFPLGFVGHYSSEGYEAISKLIINKF